MIQGLVSEVGITESTASPSIINVYIILQTFTMYDTSFYSIPFSDLSLGPYSYTKIYLIVSSREILHYKLVYRRILFRLRNVYRHRPRLVRLLFRLRLWDSISQDPYTSLVGLPGRSTLLLLFPLMTNYSLLFLSLWTSRSRNILSPKLISKLPFGCFWNFVTHWTRINIQHVRLSVKVLGLLNRSKSLTTVNFFSLSVLSDVEIFRHRSFLPWLPFHRVLPFLSHLKINYI